MSAFSLFSVLLWGFGLVVTWVCAVDKELLPKSQSGNGTRKQQQVLQAEPYIVYDNERRRWAGIFVDLLNSVCRYLDVTCKYFVPPVKGLADESLDGVLGTLTNRTAGVGVSAIGLSYSRMQYFDFFDSYFRRSYILVVHENHLISVPDSAMILQALGELIAANVWPVLAGTVVVFFVMGLAVDKFQTVVRGEQKSWLMLMDKWAFQLFGMGLGVDGIDDFEAVEIHNWSYSKTIFLCTFLLYTVIIMATIISQLPSMFSFDKPKVLPFTDIAGLLEKNYTVYGTFTAIEVLNISKIPYHRTLARRTNLFPNQPNPVLRYREYIALAKQERTALILNQESLLELAYLTCEIFVAIDDVAIVRIAGLLLPKGAPIRKDFELAFVRAQQDGVIQAGMATYDHFLRIGTRTRTRCPRGSTIHKSKPRLHALRLSDLTFLYCVLAVCVSVCLTTLVMERSWLKFHQRLTSAAGFFPRPLTNRKILP